MIAQQAVIIGQIFDAANGQPVRNATVAVKQVATLTTTTDTDGKYQLNVPVGMYTLIVKADNVLEAQIDEVNAVAGEPPRCPWHRLRKSLSPATADSFPLSQSPTNSACTRWWCRSAMLPACAF